MPAKRKDSKAPIFIAIGCGGMLVLAAILGVIILFGARSASEESDEDDGPSRPKTSQRADPEPSGEVWVKVTKPNLKFLQPPGWKQTESGRWGVFKSPDGDAVLAVAGFNRPNESTALIGRAARVLGVNQVVWNKTSRGTIGKNNFPARVGNGVCNFRGSGFISYATINPGGSDQLLVVYTVSAHGTKKHKAAVRVALDSLQRR